MLCIKKSLPKFLAFMIVDHLEYLEHFKYSYELAARNYTDNDIFIIACQVGNIGIVKKLYGKVSFSEGLTQACQFNQIIIIYFLWKHIDSDCYSKTAAHNGHMETAWLLSEKFKKVRPYILYIALNNGYGIKKFLVNNISFDFALKYAYIADKKKIIERIVKLKKPTDILIRTTCYRRDLDTLKLILPLAVNKYKVIKFMLLYEIDLFDLIFEPHLANYGLLKSAKMGNQKIVDYFISKGANDFNGALSEACKHNKNIIIPRASFCRNCEEPHDT